jgi:hypothetical protein
MVCDTGMQTGKRPVDPHRHGVSWPAALPKVIHDLPGAIWSPWL